MTPKEQKLRDVEDWEILCQFLPEGWQEEARRKGAFRRARGVGSVEALLRILLMHLACGYSLAETAVRARESGLGDLNATAVFKRLRSSEEWLRWLAEQQRTKTMSPLPNINRPVRVIDATTVSEPGSTGTDWRLHYGMNLANLQCDYFELTDQHSGETFRRIPVNAGDILLGDRGYSGRLGVAYVVDCGGDVIVRLHQQALPLCDRDGKGLDPLKQVRGLRVGKLLECEALVQHPQGKLIPGRLIIVKRTRQATKYVRKKIMQKASRQQNQVSRKTWLSAAYFFAWTSLPEEFPSETVLELYRCRWQIELAFKRLKSIMHLGHLPKKDPKSARAWLHGKLFVGLLVEYLVSLADNFSPWGYALEHEAQSVERTGLHVS